MPSRFAYDRAWRGWSRRVSKRQPVPAWQPPYQPGVPAMWVPNRISPWKYGKVNRKHAPLQPMPGRQRSTVRPAAPTNKPTRRPRPTKGRKTEKPTTPAPEPTTPPRSKRPMQHKLGSYPEFKKPKFGHDFGPVLSGAYTRSLGHYSYNPVWRPGRGQHKRRFWSY